MSPCDHQAAAEALRGAFIAKGTSVTWPPRSPDFTPPAFYLWGHVKERTHKREPQNLSKLKAAVTECVRAVTAREGLVIQRLGSFKCAFSPHCFIRALLCLPKCRRRPRRIRTRLLKNINHLSLLHDLHLIDWSGIFICSSVVDKWSYLTHRLIPVLDRHAPLRTRCVRNPQAPSVTSATLCLMAERRGVLRREGRSPAFREIDRRVRSAIRRDCRADIEARLSTQGSTSLYRTIRPLVAGKRSDTVTLPSATPDEMNTYFVNVGPRVAASLASSGVPPDVPCRLPRVGACGFRVAGVTLTELA